MKPYKPNYFLYVIMLGGLIILRVCLVSNHPTYLMNILSDFAVGGLASTLVAFMIDLASCRQKNQELVQNRVSAFRMVYTSILTNLELFADVFNCSLRNKEDESPALTLEEWIETYKCKVDSLEPARKEEVKRFIVETAVAGYELTRKEINKLLDARFLLQVSSVMDEDAYYTLRELEGEFSGTQMLVNFTQDINEKEKYIIDLSTWIFNWVKSQSEISRFCVLKFGPMGLYDPTIYTRIFSKEFLRY